MTIVKCASSEQVVQSIAGIAAVKFSAEKVCGSDTVATTRS